MKRLRLILTCWLRGHDWRAGLYEVKYDGARRIDRYRVACRRCGRIDTIDL